MFDCLLGKKGGGLESDIEAPYIPRPEYAETSPRKRRGENVKLFLLFGLRIAPECSGLGETDLPTCRTLFYVVVRPETSLENPRNIHHDETNEKEELKKTIRPRADERDPNHVSPCR